jgi:hypothetical protein
MSYLVVSHTFFASLRFEIMHTDSKKKKNPKVVIDFRPQDVLLGRGTGPNEHQGNRIYRSLVKQHKEEYLSCSSHTQKNQLVMDIIHTIRNSGGRFLKKLDPQKHRSIKPRGAPATYSELYEVAEEHIAVEKTRQVFQYFLRGNRTASVSRLASEVGDKAVAAPANETNALRVAAPSLSLGDLISRAVVAQRASRGTGTIMTANQHNFSQTRAAEDLRASIINQLWGSYCADANWLRDFEYGRFAMVNHLPSSRITQQEYAFQNALLDRAFHEVVRSSPSNYSTSPESSALVRLASLADHPSCWEQILCTPSEGVWQRLTNVTPPSQRLDWVLNNYTRAASAPRYDALQR